MLCHLLTTGYTTPVPRSAIIIFHYTTTVRQSDNIQFIQLNLMYKFILSHLLFFCVELKSNRTHQKINKRNITDASGGHCIIRNR